LRQKREAYRSVIAGRSFFDDLGPAGENWSASCVADMAMHASNKMVHHAADVGLLRALYHWQTERGHVTSVPCRLR
jgi:hypothetical protein